MLSSDLSKEHFAPEGFIVRALQSMLTPMTAWLRLPYEENMVRHIAAVVVLPATTDLEVVDAALNALTPTHAVGLFFGGPCQSAEGNPHPYFFDAASPCVVIGTEKNEDPLGLAQILAELLCVEAALVVYPDTHQFHVIERRPQK